MSWALLIVALVLGGVGLLLATMTAINRAVDEEEHYRLSVRFWGTLAVLGGCLLLAFAQPLFSFDWQHSEGGMLEAGVATVLLASLLPAVVIVAGTRNALMLDLARRRRRGALDHGVTVEAQVVERRRRFLGQDIMAVVVEADVPRPIPGREVGYRVRERDATWRRRFVETCPGDHWLRFTPGQRVRLKYDPSDAGTWALLLFE